MRTTSGEVKGTVEGFWTFEPSSIRSRRRFARSSSARGRRAGSDAIGGLEEATVCRDGDLAEAPELEVLARGERLGEREEHALDRLEGDPGRSWQVVGLRRDGPSPQTSTAVTGEIWVWPKDSAAVPLTRTRSPASTGVIEAANKPSDVAGSRSGVSS